MKKGQKVKMVEMDYLDLPQDLKYYQQFELFYTGKVDDSSERYDCFDDDDNPVIDTAYQFEYHDNDNDLSYVWLFENNFEVIKKKKPKTEIEFLDAFQRNFRE